MNKTALNQFFTLINESLDISLNRCVNIEHSTKESKSNINDAIYSLKETIVDINEVENYINNNLR